MTVARLKHDIRWGALQPGNVINLNDQYHGITVLGVVLEKRFSKYDWIKNSVEIVISPIMLTEDQENEYSVEAMRTIEVSIKHNDSKLIIDGEYAWELEIICDT